MKRIAKILVVLSFLSVNLILLFQMWHFCLRYPLDRIQMDGKIHHSVRLFNKDLLYNAAITAVDDVKLKKKRVVSYFNRLNAAPQTITVMTSKGEISIHNEAFKFNTDFFIFLFFILLVGNVHCLWGLTVFFVKDVYSSARYYSRYSMNFGLYFFAFIYYIISGSHIPLMIASVSLFYQLIKMLTEMGLQSYKLVVSRVALVLSILSGTALTIAYRGSVVFFNSWFLSATICAVVLFAFIGVRKNLKIGYRPRTLLMVVLAGIIGILVPLLSLIFIHHMDFPFPLSLAATLTIITPVVIGRNFIERSQFNEIITRKIYSTQFLLDLAASVLIALMLTLVYLFKGKQEALFVPVLTILTMIFLTARKIIARQIQNDLQNNRDWQTSSIQKIIETSIQTRSFTGRLKRIHNEVATHLGASVLSIALFEASAKSLLDEELRHIHFLEKDDPIVEYYLSHRDIIKRDLLFRSDIDKQLTSLFENESFYIVIPITHKGKVVGIIFAAEKRRGVPFFKNDFDYLSSAGTIIYQMFENEQLFKESLIRGRYEQELDKASYVQMRLFPIYVSTESGMDISVYTRPYNKVTGDYFDVVRIDENKTAILMGDITGHGLPAAMLHSSMAALITSLFEQKKSLTELFLALNEFLVTRYRGYELITLFGCIFDKSKGEIEYINAGHPMPILIFPKAGSIQTMESRGHILGVSDDPGYRAQRYQLIKGTQLFLYTDGVTEIQREFSESNLGTTFLEKELLKHVAEPIESKLEKITSFIDKTRSGHISDDITIAIMEVE